MMDYRKDRLFRRKVLRGCDEKKTERAATVFERPLSAPKRRWNADEAFTAQIGDAIASPEAPRSGNEALVALAVNRDASAGFAASGGLGIMVCPLCAQRTSCNRL